MQKIKVIDHLIVQIALLCGLMLGWLSIARYAGYNAGMLDLGVMAQSIWTGTQGLPLVRTDPIIGQISRLSTHVEFIYFLIVPLYTLWPDPRLLLILQATIFVLGALPVYRITMRRTENKFAARCIAIIYLFYPTAQTSVLFDFHGDTLAMPILLFVLDALDARAWRSYIFFTILALMCKFYVAIPVAGIGGYLLLWGTNQTVHVQQQTDRFVGIATLVTGMIYGAATFFVVRSLFAPATGGVTTTTGSYIRHYFQFEIWSTLGDRLISALVVFGPVFLFMKKGWRWLLPGLPVAFIMLLSSSKLGGAYDFRYHHYAIVVPFILMATIDGLEKNYKQPVPKRQGNDEQTQQPRRRGRNWRGDLIMTTISVLLFNVLLVDTPLNPLFWLKLPGQGLDPSVYGITARDTLKDQFLQEHPIPPDAALATSTLLAPHQANREQLFIVRNSDDSGAERLPSILPLVDYVMADALFDFYLPLDETSYGGGVTYERDAIALMLQNPTFPLVAANDGLLLFRRNAAQEQALEQQIEVLQQASPISLTLFGKEISLIRSEIEMISARRFQATFDWMAIGPNAPAKDYIAISRLDTMDGFRIVHLPTYGLLPPTKWQPGKVIRERFMGDIPSDVAPGEYLWRVAWYVPDHPYSYATDERTLLPGSQQMVVGKIVVNP